MTRDPQEPQIPATTLRELQKLEKLQTILKQDKASDCLSCKLIGATAFTGLGLYSYFSGKNQLERQKAVILKSGSRFGLKSRQAGITGIAMTLVGMGLWRLLN